MQKFMNRVLMTPARLVGVTNRAEAIELGVSLKTGFQKVKGWGGSRVLDQVTRGLDWRMEGGRWNTSNFTGRMSSVFVRPFLGKVCTC